MLFNLTTRAKGRHADLDTTEPGSSQREGENGYSLRNINNTDMGVISKEPIAAAVDNTEGIIYQASIAQLLFVSTAKRILVIML